MQAHPKITPQHMSQLNEAVWLQIGKLLGEAYQTTMTILTHCAGNLAELMNDLDGAVSAYEQALRHNQYSIQAMNAVSCILRTKENFPRAVEYLQAILKLDASNGEVWGSLGMVSTTAASAGQVANAVLRALLLDDGRSSTSLFCIPASSIPFERSKSMRAMTSC